MPCSKIDCARRTMSLGWNMTPLSLALHKAATPLLLTFHTSKAPRRVFVSSHFLTHSLSQGEMTSPNKSQKPASNDKIVQDNPLKRPEPHIHNPDESWLRGGYEEQVNRNTFPSESYSNDALMPRTQSRARYLIEPVPRAIFALHCGFKLDKATENCDVDLLPGH